MTTLLLSVALRFVSWCFCYAHFGSARAVNAATITRVFSPLLCEQDVSCGRSSSHEAIIQ